MINNLVVYDCIISYLKIKDNINIKNGVSPHWSLHFGQDYRRRGVR